MGFSEFPPQSGGGIISSGTISLAVGPLDGAAKSVNGGTIGSSNLYFQTATATFPGYVSSAAQTFAGVKTFSSNPIFSGVTASSPLRTGSGGALSVGSTSLVNEVSGSLPLSQTSGSISLTTQVSGILPVENLPSGTIIGSVSLTSQVSGVLPAANTEPLSALTGSVSLTAQVSGELPITQTSGSVSLTNKVSGVLPQANMTGVTGSNTGDVSFASVGSSPNGQGASVGAGQVVTLQAADGTNPGLLTASAQVIGGAKTFSSIRAGVVTTGSVSQTQTAGGSGYTLSWPQTVGSGSNFLSNDGSGNLSWTTPTITNQITTVTANYTVGANDTHVIVNSSNFTVTLFSPLGSTRQVTIKNVAPSNTLGVTIVSSQTGTIGNMTSLLMKTYGDSVTLFADGSNWQVGDFGISVAAVMRNTVGSTTAGILPNFSEVPSGNTLGSFTAIYDTQSGYNVSSSTYTFKVSGTYRISAEGQFTGSSLALGNSVGYKFMRNGLGLYQMQDQASANATVSLCVVYTGYFNVGDYMTIQARSQATAPSIIDPLWTIERIV